MQRLVLFIALLSLVAADSAACTSPSFDIRDDASLTQTIQQVRAEFLSHVAMPKFDRLESVIMLPVKSQDGTVLYWLRGQTANATQTAYPASTVKLAYMTHAIKWCQMQGKPVNCLDKHVRPMITYSDNFETGIVVDMITGTPNVFNDSIPFAPWAYARLNTERFLNSFGLLGNQRVMHKTYPTNSGDNPYGYEKRAREQYGMNAMHPQCMSLLLLDVLKGGKVLGNDDVTVDYVKSMTFHRRFDGWTAYHALPPGTLIHNKIGNAYDTIEDVANIVLPNGQEAILVTYSNGYQRPTDMAILGVYAEMLFQRLNLYVNNPPDVIITVDQSENYTKTGSWHAITDPKDKMGKSVLITSDSTENAQVAFHFVAPAEGIYEIKVYNPTIQQRLTHSMPTTVNHEYGTDSTGYSPQHASQWTIIGDYYFKQGMNKNALIIKAGSDGTTSMVNAVRFTRYPYCNNVPGDSCKN